jgi:hypothetical protein
VSEKVVNIDGNSRVPLTVLYGALLLIVPGVWFLARYAYSIDKRLASLEGTQALTVQEQENWVLRAKAANVVKFPDFVWPPVKNAEESRSSSTAVAVSEK